MQSLVDYFYAFIVQFFIYLFPARRRGMPRDLIQRRHSLSEKVNLERRLAAVIDGVNRSETETARDTRKAESLVCHGTSQVQRFDAPTASNIPFKEKQVHPNIF